MTNYRQYNGLLIGGRASWSPDAARGGNATELNKGEYVVVQMLEGPTDVEFFKVTFEDVPSGRLQSTWEYSNGRWVVSGDSPSPNDFVVAVGSDRDIGVSPQGPGRGGRKGKAVKITDNQDVKAGDEKRHEMKVWLRSNSQSGGPWCLDPEIVNKGGETR